MRKVKSRNFILMVCGVLITLLLGVAIAKTIISVIDEFDSKDKIKEIENNIFSSSSKVILKGNGNFLGNTPKITKTTITDFQVKMKSKEDFVSYEVEFCNMNDVKIIYKDLIIEDITCKNAIGSNSSCDNIEIDGYVLNKKKKLYKNSVIDANSCIRLVVDAKYTGDISEEVIVNVKRVQLQLDVE